MQRLWSAVRGLWRIEDDDEDEDEETQEEEREHHRHHHHHRNHDGDDEPSYRGGPDRTRMGQFHGGYEDDAHDEDDFGEYEDDRRWSPDRYVHVSRLSSLEERGLPGRSRAEERESPGSTVGLPRVYSSGSIRERAVEAASAFVGRVMGSPSLSTYATPPPSAPSASVRLGHHEGPSLSRPPSRQTSRQLSWRDQEWLPPRRRHRRRKSSGGTEQQASPATASERSAGTAAGAPIGLDLEGGQPGPWEEGSRNGDQPPLRETHSAKLLDLEQTLSATARIQVERFKRTLQVLGLHAASSSSSASAMALSSWLIAMILLVATPLYSAYFVQPSDDLPEHQLPFQTLVLMIQVSLGLNSFVFIIATVKAHGMHGVLFLSAAANEAPSVQAEYEKCLQQSSGMLWQCLLPLFVMHIFHKALLYSSIPLKLLPFDQGLPLPPAPSSSLTASSLSSSADSAILVAALLSALPLPPRLKATFPFPSLASLRLPLAALVFLLTSASWLFSTSTYLFSCVIFWKVCSLQEFKMLVYREQVRHGADPAACLRGYMRITSSLGVISKRFRRFLLHSFAISIFGGLASMYKMIQYQGRLTFTNSGHLVVANIVSLFGTFLCMRSGSRLAHHHRRIVRVAALMHAQHTLEGHHASAGAMACSSRRWSAFRYERLMAEARTAATAASTVEALSLVARTASAFQRQIQEHPELQIHDTMTPEYEQPTVQLQDSELTDTGLKQPLLTQQQQALQEQDQVEQQERGPQPPVFEGLQQQHQAQPQQQHPAVYVRQASTVTRDSSPAGGEYKDTVGRLPPRESGGSSTNRLEQRIILFSRRQNAYMQRAALVEYLSNTSAGISIYGFVLDRFLIHTSIGALLTTTWFILGRSLSGSG